MSLDVPPSLLAQAEHGEINEAAFVATVRDSLPYAWETISGLVAHADSTLSDWADNQVPPPDETARGQLLRAMSSDAIRGALERHFGMKLAFQNCHRVAVFRPSAVSSDLYRAFISPRAQLLNQSPELRNC